MTTFGLDDDTVRRLAADVTDGSLETLSAASECFARAAWSVLAEPGDGAAGALVAERGAAGALTTLLGASGGALAPEIPADARERWMPRLKSADVERALRSAARLGVRLLMPGVRADDEAATGPIGDDSVDAWGSGLCDLGEHAPVALWARGDPMLAGGGTPAVAMVGARAATGYGEHVAGELAAGLAEKGARVVSGAAYGIDGMTHRAALAAGGGTVAFLAGGVDRFYPAGHDGLLKRIVEHGLVLSELPCGAAPTKWRFLARNRLIAAACGATVVVEAGARSGSLNTAGHAAALSRAIGAVPGPVTSPSSAGCHRLLRDYDAVCVTSVADVLELLPGRGMDASGAMAPPSSGTAGQGTRSPTTRGSEHRDPPEAVRVLDALGVERARTADEIAALSGLAVMTVLGVLAGLDVEGRVVARDGGWCAVPRRR